MSPTEYYKKLVAHFSIHRVAEDAPSMKRYMKDQFDFLGVKSPLRKELLRSFIKENKLPEGNELISLVTLLWQNPNREFQYIALDILGKKTKGMDEVFLPFFEKLILTKSWWDTVDWLAPNGSGKLFQKYPTHLLSYTERWNQSDNIWLQRASLLFQLKYRAATDFELLKKYILNLAESKEFFIRKGAGWALRQYAKYNPDEVRTFVETNKSILSNLTIREALKHIG